MPEWYDWMADDDQLSRRDNFYQQELHRYQQALMRACDAQIRQEGLTQSIEELANKYLSGEQYD